jgi:hypothetical protein
MKQTDFYRSSSQEEEMMWDEDDEKKVCSGGRKRSSDLEAVSPRRKRRQRALRVAKDIEGARRRQTVVGRPSWPMDQSDGPARYQQEA